MSSYYPPIYLPHLTLSFPSAGCLSFFFNEVVCKVFKNPTAEQVAFALVTLEHQAAKVRKDGVSEIDEARIYTRALRLAGFKNGTSLATARELFAGADDDGAEGPGADEAGADGADGAGVDGADGAGADGAGADGAGAQSGSRRRRVVAPNSEEEAGSDDARNRAPKQARTNVYASPAGKAPASSSSGVVSKASSPALPGGRVTARGLSAGSSSSAGSPSSSRGNLTERPKQRSGGTGTR